MFTLAWFDTSLRSREKRTDARMGVHSAQRLRAHRGDLDDHLTRCRGAGLLGEPARPPVAWCDARATSVSWVRRRRLDPLLPKCTVGLPPPGRPAVYAHRPL